MWNSKLKVDEFMPETYRCSSDEGSETQTTYNITRLFLYFINHTVVTWCSFNQLTVTSAVQQNRATIDVARNGHCFAILFAGPMRWIISRFSFGRGKRKNRKSSRKRSKFSSKGYLEHSWVFYRQESAAPAHENSGCPTIAPSQVWTGVSWSSRWLSLSGVFFPGLCDCVWHWAVVFSIATGWSSIEFACWSGFIRYLIREGIRSIFNTCEFD